LAKVAAVQVTVPAAPTAGVPAAPSLSDALGTNRLQIETKKTGTNYLDTLTGNAIQR